MNIGNTKISALKDNKNVSSLQQTTIVVVVVLNDDTEQKSVVDIFIASPAIIGKLTWNVHEDTMGSVHYPIMIEYGNE